MVIWTGLLMLVIFLLLIDLLVLHKKGSVLTPKKAAIETLLWILIAGSFSIIIYWVYDKQLIANSDQLNPTTAVLKYITGYLIELSLSVDNLFVIAMIFSSFKIPLKNQHKVLFWGILGAIVFRGLMIWAGVLLIHKLSWITYVFGIFLLFTAFRMLAKEDDESKPSKFKDYLYKHLKVSKTLDGEKFWVIENGEKMERKW